MLCAMIATRYSPREESHVRQAHRIHRRVRQGRPPRRSASRRPWLFGAQRRFEAARPAGRADLDRGSHRQRPGLQRADDASDLRRLHARPPAAPAGRGGAFRRDPPGADRTRQHDLRYERDQHIQRHRSGDEARRAQGRHRLQRDDLRRLLRRGRQGFPRVPARRGLRRRSDGLLRSLQGLQRKDRPRLRDALSARTSMRCASAT